MHIDTDIILTYFECKLVWKGDIPKLNIALKEEYKLDTTYPFRPGSRIPYSCVEKEYYIHYFGDTELANTLFTERKKLASKNIQLKWWMGVVELDDIIVDNIEEYLYNIGKNISNKLNTHYKSEAGDITKQKLKKRSEQWAPIIGKINSDKWKDDSWREREMKRRDEDGFYDKVAEKNRNRMSDPEYNSMFMQAVNKPSRVDKISKSSKAMWVRMKRDKPDGYYKIINSGPNKNFTLNGYDMNMVEYIMGNTLNQLNLEWVYEKDFNFNGKVYVPDFYIEAHKLVIECYGDYWHANPSMYSVGDVVFKRILVEDVWGKDDIRRNTFTSNGYRFASCWESDIKNNIDIIKKEICQNI